MKLFHLNAVNILKSEQFLCYIHSYDDLDNYLQMLNHMKKYPEFYVTF